MNRAMDDLCCLPTDVGKGWADGTGMGPGQGRGRPGEGKSDPDVLMSDHRTTRHFLGLLISAPDRSRLTFHSILSGILFEARSGGATSRTADSIAASVSLIIVGIRCLGSTPQDSASTVRAPKESFR